MGVSSGFIFDMDGTLMDSIRAWHEAERRIMDEAGVVLSKEQRDELNALTLEEAGEFFHRRFGIRSSGGEVVQAIMDYMLDFYRTCAEANPGAAAFVDAMAGEGAPLCVLSSSPQSFLQAGLVRAGLISYFDPELILSVEDLGTTKRETVTYGRVCELLGCAPADTWLFDDSWYALACAREAGLRCVGVYSADACGTHEELARYSELVVDSFAELSARDFLARS